jgi:hypothetical protein
MPRPHIEFLHAQQLPWRATDFPGEGWSSIQFKILSRDAHDGACSVLLSLPAGYSSAAHALAASHELFVIDGEFELDGQRYGLDSYAYLPAGCPRSGWHSARGAIVLCFFDRSPQWLAAAAGREWDRSALIRHIDTHNTPWTRHDIDPSVQFLNLAHKVLRHIPATGEKTLLLSSGAQTHPAQWREARLRHDCVEEMYLLGGDLIGERGTMYEGAYFWRPPGQWHGPFGSRRGSLSLIRFCDGQHRNIWSEDVREFSLTPAHAPQLPEELRLAARAWDPQRY